MWLASQAKNQACLRGRIDVEPATPRAAFRAAGNYPGLTGSVTGVICHSPTHSISMKASTRNKAAGTARIIKGDAKIALGKVTRNRLLESKGRAQELLGKLQRDVGQRQKAKGN